MASQSVLVVFNHVPTSDEIEEWITARARHLRELRHLVGDPLHVRVEIDAVTYRAVQFGLTGLLESVSSDYIVNHGRNRPPILAHVVGVIYKRPNIGDSQ